MTSAEGLVQRPLGGRLVPSGVAVLVEQTLARGQDRALAVMVDGPALEHEAMGQEPRPGVARDLRRHILVTLQHVFAAPPVEAE